MKNLQFWSEQSWNYIDFWNSLIRNCSRKFLSGQLFKLDPTFFWPFYEGRSSDLCYNMFIYIYLSESTSRSSITFQIDKILTCHFYLIILKEKWPFNIHHITVSGHVRFWYNLHILYINWYPLRNFIEISSKSINSIFNIKSDPSHFPYKSFSKMN